MADDPLYQALGTGSAGRRPFPTRREGRWALILVALAVAGTATALAVRHAGRDATGIAVARIEVAPKPAPTPLPSPGADTAAAPSADASGVEIQNGVKVIRLAPATSSQMVALAVPAGKAIALKPAPDPRLVEETRFGPLPRIGADGARPAEVYARPSPPGSGPRVALVVGDMGLNQTRTALLAQRVPGAVTFAFPPDGPDLPTQIRETRAAGHEVLLQGSAGADAAAGEPQLDRLHRAMGRFTGYVGVSLARGSAEQEAADLRDIETRGLLALDTVPPPAGVPRPDGVQHVDLAVADAGDPTLLDRLADRVRASGAAVAWLAGPDPGAEKLATLAAGLAARNIELVPLSAVVARAGSAPRAAK